MVFAWLVTLRFRLAWLQEQADQLDVDEAVVERRAEAGRLAEEVPS